MRTFLLTIAFATLTTTSFGQNTSDSLYGMTKEQNIAWLRELKNADKDRQLTLIQNRFFRQSTFKKLDTDDIPVLVVDGIPISEQMNLKLKNVLAYQITADKVEIKVLDKEPGQLYVNKRWAGLILLNITDKKMRKRMYKCTSECRHERPTIYRTDWNDSTARIIELDEIRLSSTDRARTTSIQTGLNNEARKDMRIKLECLLLPFLLLLWMGLGINPCFAQNSTVETKDTTTFSRQEPRPDAQFARPDELGSLAERFVILFF